MFKDQQRITTNGRTSHAAFASRKTYGSKNRHLSLVKTRSGRQSFSDVAAFVRISQRSLSLPTRGAGSDSQKICGIEPSGAPTHHSRTPPRQRRRGFMSTAIRKCSILNADAPLLWRSSSPAPSCIGTFVWALGFGRIYLLPLLPHLTPVGLRGSSSPF